MSPQEQKIKPKSGFLNRNIVAIVMIPSIIAMHWMWTLLQNNETLVKKDERIELPIITAGKVLWSKLQGVDKADQKSKEIK